MLERYYMCFPSNVKMIFGGRALFPISHKEKPPFSSPFRFFHFIPDRISSALYKSPPEGV